MRTQEAVVYENADARARLAELNINGEAIREAVVSGLTARFSCSENAPRTAPGLLQWTTSTEVCREAHALDGWSRTDIDNFPLSVSPDGRIAIGIVMGNAGTGQRDGNPTT